MAIHMSIPMCSGRGGSLESEGAAVGEAEAEADVDVEVEAASVIATSKSLPALPPRPLSGKSPRPHVESLVQTVYQAATATCIRVVFSKN